METDTTVRRGLGARILPALTLVVLAPAVAEVLPGATRLSSIFVFPVEMGVWGVGALLIRAAVRRWNLGWKNMLLLAFALAFAEEFVIRQSSLAPMVLQIVPGPDYARAFGVNWIYLLWALGYESVFVVFLPVLLTELIFRSRRCETWINGTGTAVAAGYFGLASFLAWFTWTQIARPKVFHLPAYVPPAVTVEIALAVIAILVFAALGPARARFARPSAARSVPTAWLAGALAFAASVLWYGLVILAFGAYRDFPVSLAAGGGGALALVVLATFPRWSDSALWSDGHRFAAVFGAMTGAMAVGFAGFINAAPLDLYGKAVLDAAAVALLIVLGVRLRRKPAPAL